MSSLIPVPKGMCPAFYEFMGAGAPRSDSGEILMLNDSPTLVTCPRCQTKVPLAGVLLAPTNDECLCPVCERLFSLRGEEADYCIECGETLLSGEMDRCGDCRNNPLDVE